MIITVLVVHVLGIVLIVFSAILYNCYLVNINKTSAEEILFKDIHSKIHNNNFRNHWKQIHSDFSCCGIKSIQEFNKKYNYTLSMIIGKENISLIDKKLLENAENYGIDLYLCNNIPRTYHLGCGGIIFSVLERTTALFKLYGLLALPSLITQNVLMFIGYFELKNFVINVWKSYLFVVLINFKRSHNF